MPYHYVFFEHLIPIETIRGYSMHPNVILFIFIFKVDLWVPFVIHGRYFQFHSLRIKNFSFFVNAISYFVRQFLFPHPLVTPLEPNPPTPLSDSPNSSTSINST